MQFLANGIISGSIYALTGLGFALIYRSVRFFHFAHGAVYAVGAYAAYAFAISSHVTPIAAFFLPACLRRGPVSSLIV
jgi:branched-chain amino acid transport system permease protein